MRFQTHLIYLAICLVLLLIVLGEHSCINQYKAKLEQKCPDGLIQRDTIRVKDSSQTGWYQPQPEMAFLEGGHIPDEIPGAKTSSLLGSKGFKELDSNNLELEHLKPISEPEYQGNTPQDYSLFYYSDTVPVKYGRVIIQDTTNGQILARRVFADLDIPVITNTVTVQQPPKAQFYFGFIGQYDLYTTGVRAGPSLLYKTKKDRIYELAALAGSGPIKQPIIQGSVKFKL
jgi:hypothetical protein